MGTWGAGIFDCDLANDVREDFMGSLRTGSTPEEATEELKQSYAPAINDADDGPVFWAALAETQWDLGRLVDEVRNRASKALELPIDKQHWASLYDARIAEFQRLSEKLNSAQPAKKRIRRWKPKYTSGDVFSLELPNELIVYGRILVVFPPQSGFPEHCFAAYYALNWQDTVLPGKRKRMRGEGLSWEEIEDVGFDIEDVVDMDIALISHYPSELEALQPRTIGHIPLEDRLRQPIWFYRRTTDGCCVFDIWRFNRGRTVPLSSVPATIPPWNDFGLDQVLLRLGVSVISEEENGDLSSK